MLNQVCNINGIRPTGNNNIITGIYVVVELIIIKLKSVQTSEPIFTDFNFSSITTYQLDKLITMNLYIKFGVCIKSLVTVCTSKNQHK